MPCELTVFLCPTFLPITILSQKTFCNIIFYNVNFCLSSWTHIQDDMCNVYHRGANDNTKPSFRPPPPSYLPLCPFLSDPPTSTSTLPTVHYWWFRLLTVLWLLWGTHRHRTNGWVCRAPGKWNRKERKCVLLRVSVSRFSGCEHRVPPKTTFEKSLYNDIMAAQSWICRENVIVHVNQQCESLPVLIFFMWPLFLITLKNAACFVFFLLCPLLDHWTIVCIIIRMCHDHNLEVEVPHSVVAWKLFCLIVDFPLFVVVVECFWLLKDYHYFKG